MTNLGQKIADNTKAFYKDLEESALIREDFLTKQFDKSKRAISNITDMFQDLAIEYSLDNVEGKAVLKTEVLLFDEDLTDKKLYLNISSEIKVESANDVAYMSCYLVSENARYTSKNVYKTEEELCLAFSDEILEILQVRKLDTFINNFGTLYNK